MNYVANAEVNPTRILFENGRVVELRDGALEVGWSREEAARIFRTEYQVNREPLVDALQYARQWISDTAQDEGKRAVTGDGTDLLKKIDAALRTLAEGKDRWRHIARGGEYAIEGKGTLQTAAPLADGAELYAYRGADGRWWFRTPPEFHDGRFERIDTSRTVANTKQGEAP